jgi:peptide/nickel transport system ATP-binding protein
MSPVLEVENLSIDYLTGNTSVRALDKLSLAIAAGETVGVIGESGSGKSTLAYAVARHLAGNARITGGSIRVLAEDVAAMDEGALKRMRRRVLGMVYQNSAAALNPTIKVGRQLIEAVAVRGTSSPQAPARALELLEQVRIREPVAIMDRFAHQISGGERQRLMIAMAIAGNPRLLNLDEPTSSLDADTARSVLELIVELRDRLGAAVLYISHDLETVSRLTDRLLILRGGRVIEVGSTRRLLDAPQAEYTKVLLDSRPGQLRENRSIAAARAGRPQQPDILLRVRDLSVTYARAGLLGQLGLGRAPDAPALVGASFDIAAGRTIAVIGRSGSGKSTLGRALVGLVPFSGRVSLGGRNYDGARAFDALYRRAVQIVFQNPDTSLNPRHRIGEILGRPLRLLGRAAGKAEIAALLEEVQLPAAFAQRYPHQLSGGQRQRAAIARALAARPELIICDEITSALDVSTQAAVIALLARLQRHRNTAFLFISHDMDLVRSFADEVITIDHGRIVDRQH